MQQMLAGIAHEVRNPLAGMTLFAGILRDELPDGDERRGHVDEIERELGYLERVVNDFLEYARRPRPELADVPVARAARRGRAARVDRRARRSASRVERRCDRRAPIAASCAARCSTSRATRCRPRRAPAIAAPAP